MQCPGQDSRYWTGADVYEIECPICGNAVEFFKDDSQRKCLHCGHRMFNSRMDFGCASYCPYAEQCLGSLPSEFLEKRDNLFKDRLADLTRARLDNDHAAVLRSERCSHLAEGLGREEKAQLGAVVAAAQLHVFAGTGAVREILAKAEAKPALIDQVEAILAGFRKAGDASDLNTQVVHDAELLARADADRQAEQCITPAGRRAAGRAD